MTSGRTSPTFRSVTASPASAGLPGEPPQKPAGSAPSTRPSVTSSRNAQTRSPTPPPEIGEREYVLNLHRLGRDLPWNLPEPPAASAFHKRWALEEQPRGPAEDNIFGQIGRASCRGSGVVCVWE